MKMLPFELRLRYEAGPAIRSKYLGAMRSAASFRIGRSGLFIVASDIGLPCSVVRWFGFLIASSIGRGSKRTPVDDGDRVSLGRYHSPRFT